MTPLPPTIRPHRDIVSRSIGGEMVLVPVKGERGDLETLYRLDPIGAFIWQRLAEEAKPETIVHELVAGWEVDEETARRDLARFLAELAEAGLLAEEECRTRRDAGFESAKSEANGKEHP